MEGTVLYILGALNESKFIMISINYSNSYGVPVSLRAAAPGAVRVESKEDQISSLTLTHSVSVLCNINGKPFCHRVWGEFQLLVIIHIMILTSLFVFLFCFSSSNAFNQMLLRKWRQPSLARSCSRNHSGLLLIKKENIFH